ncbi:hypothetical protein BDV29DRAFT_188527 [Aspergillus leporis]|uniref:Uncharacterized protein n=1 Tax=Aspergillus leporis TaxID=41062 RepID=A0A5N5XC46_9EURO|nr:hypothetical protein BDV29DRAFT_188527 [Aspergillus leporis]
MTVVLRPRLREEVTRHQTSLESAIDTCWPSAEFVSRQYAKWEVNGWWVMSTVQATEFTVPQVVHYYLLEGHLLVDGQTMGKLPADIRDSDTLKALFGNQRLVAYPSNMYKMSYMLAANQEGHAWQNVELIPRHVFGEGADMDLPGQLVDNCFHWLDLQSGVRRNASLVNPHSSSFGLIAEIFQVFEQPHMLTLAQPFFRNLTVELKRMDLTFYVNKKYWLQCTQLDAEIDPNQDAGTLYGLQSMLVLRRVKNLAHRTIITTLGRPYYRRQGMHALLHEFTSYFMPDPLTGRTGTEEALLWLQSGCCQPWSPLAQVSLKILNTLLALTPRREYYPKDKKNQQTVYWGDQLTTTIQHDAYQSVVECTLKKSEGLAAIEMDNKTDIAAMTPLT